MSNIEITATITERHCWLSWNHATPAERETISANIHWPEEDLGGSLTYDVPIGLDYCLHLVHDICDELEIPFSVAVREYRYCPGDDGPPDHYVEYVVTETAEQAVPKVFRCRATKRPFCVVTSIDDDGQPERIVFLVSLDDAEELWVTKEELPNGRTAECGPYKDPEAALNAVLNCN